MRKTTASPALVGSPTRVAIWTPLGKAGLSFHVSASGATCVCLSCAIAEHETAIKAAAIKSFFIAVLLYAASRRKPDIRQRGDGTSGVASSGHRAGPVLGDQPRRRDSRS